MNHIRLYNIFRKEMHLSDASAEEVVNAMQDHTVSVFESKKNLLATKEDLSLLKEDVSLLKADISLIKGDLSYLKNEITSFKKEWRADKGDLYKAIYLTGFLQFIAMIGTVLAVIKFIK
jgi:chromosome segregation ATPase